MTGLAPAVILWMLTILGVVAAHPPLPRRPEPGVRARTTTTASSTGTASAVCPAKEPREVGLP